MTIGLPLFCLMFFGGVAAIGWLMIAADKRGASELTVFGIWACGTIGITAAIVAAASVGG